MAGHERPAQEVYFGEMYTPGRLCATDITHLTELADALMVCEQKRTPIDLILTDVVMPHMSRCELIARMSELDLGIKALYMTG